MMPVDDQSSKQRRKRHDGFEMDGLFNGSQQPSALRDRTIRTTIGSYGIFSSLL